MPTGGVNSPIIRFSTMTRPNCTGSIPTCTAIGSNTGVRIVIAAMVSRKQPTTRSRTLIMLMITIGSRLMESIASAKASVTRVVARIQPKIEAPPTMNSTTAVVSIVSMETRTSWRQESER